MENIVGGKFNLGRKIGSGSFGELYLGELISHCFIISLIYQLYTHAYVLGVDIQTGEEVAMKLVCFFESKQQSKRKTFYNLRFKHAIKISLMFNYLIKGTQIFRSLSKQSILNFNMSQNCTFSFREEVSSL